MIGGATRRGVLIVLMASGCDQLFQLDHIEPVHAPDDSAVPSNDAPALARCTSPLIRETFDTIPACAPWGEEFQVNAGTSLDSGLFKIIPGWVMTADSVGGCRSLGEVKFGDGGVAVRVLDIVRGPATYTLLQLHSGATTLVQIGATGDGRVRMQIGPSQDIGTNVDYSPLSLWWRLRPLPAPLVAGEYSADGVEWNLLGTVPIAELPANVTIEINAGANASMVMGSVIYDELIACP